MGQYFKPCILNEEGKVIKAVYSHDFNCGLKLMEHAYQGSGLVEAFESCLQDGFERVVWAGDYADEDYYAQALDITCTPARVECRQYIVNATKGLFVDRHKQPRDGKNALDPLPLLTCVGNGRGGGDYFKEHKLLGSWAGDYICTTQFKPEGVEELLVEF